MIYLVAVPTFLLPAVHSTGVQACITSVAYIRLLRIIIINKFNMKMITNNKINQIYK